MPRPLTILTTVLGLATAPAVSATYSYVGNTFNDTASAFDNPAIDGAYTSANRVTGSFTISTALSANMEFTDISALLTSFSFTDGKNTFTEANSFIFAFSIGTSGRAISDWWIRLGSLAEPFVLDQGDLFVRLITRTRNATQPTEFDQGFEMLCEVTTCDGYSEYRNGDTRQEARVTDAAGVWTGTVVPLPPAALLLLPGLAALGALRAGRRG